MFQWECSQEQSRSQHLSLHGIYTKRTRIDFILDELLIIKIKNLIAWILSHQKKNKHMTWFGKRQTILMGFKSIFDSLRKRSILWKYLSDISMTSWYDIIMSLLKKLIAHIQIALMCEAYPFDSWIFQNVLGAFCMC